MAELPAFVARVASAGAAAADSAGSEAEALLRLFEVAEERAECVATDELSRKYGVATNNRQTIIKITK